ncbi:hypothetical protein VNO77_00684 [Canavalia gladiata]|uniref:Knottins-like domain-containing protein n=1 Tax=Canavalia gladiata TaxID=3824 RepID=A0AAN9R4L4_CANGL
MCIMALRSVMIVLFFYWSYMSCKLIVALLSVLCAHVAELHAKLKFFLQAKVLNKSIPYLVGPFSLKTHVVLDLLSHLRETDAPIWKLRMCHLVLYITAVMERKTLGLLFFLLLVFAADVGVKRAEGRTCLSKSHSFTGPCLRDSNCAHVCRTEGFYGGDCRGLRRRCFCTKFC